MEATGCTREELHPDMDLRHDLSLRSSRFPLIMHDVEKRFGLTLRFDDLLGVATVRDLAHRIHHLNQGENHQETSTAQQPEHVPQPAPCHFSHFRDFWLRDARPWPDSPHSCIPPSMQLAALIADATQLFPQLTPAGAEELSFSMAECPSGVTREGRVHCSILRAQAGLRQCQAELRLRDLRPNGRAKRTYSPICAARILLMPDTPKMLTPILPDPTPVSASVMPAGPATLRNFYERHTGFGPSFRLLTELYVLEEKRLLAQMRVPYETDLAGLETSRYICQYYAFEAAAQAALLLALKRIAGQNNNSRLALSRIHAVRFSWGCVPGETLELELRNNADGTRSMHFDAELRNAHGHIVLTLSGICLNAA
jgi:acyl carrier protein